MRYTLHLIFGAINLLLASYKWILFYLTWNKPLSDLFFLYVSFKSKSAIPVRKYTPPWPMSPNITPNWKGKVMIVKMAGFTSWYLGTPYVSTICWKGAVKSFNWKYVGGVKLCFSGVVISVILLWLPVISSSRIH